MKTWTGSVSVIVLCLIINNAYADFTTNNALIVNFTELVKAVESGNDVKAIIHLDRCQITDPTTQSQLAQNLIGASTRFNFTQYLHYNVRVNGQLKDTVTTTMTSSVELPVPGVFWSVFGRLSVFDDDTATLYVDYFDPLHHQSHLVVEWRCDISNGKDTNGLVLINGF
ncbi:hypothetical protein Lmor_2745 [Legionella moravica]|uniref:VirK protein n=1 Tax=Legionella moravica TaxID=39962 RepID=A0A378JTE8_9GAMM|nr:MULTISPECIES: hypothetical protein [Legionella]KTD31248.1 hypothetical protein Lmor_2745 [Legionella moravica]RUR19481.1 hypothetical protein ELY21_04475 [Legionella sp. km535]STX61923.1 Uncharacterised protein [Legionella moravica]